MSRLKDIPASRSKRPKVSKTTQARLDEDDAEIAALERKLGIRKKSKKSRQSAEDDDGIEGLLGEIDALYESDSQKQPDKSSKRKLTAGEDDDWLEQKRRKVVSDDRAPDSDFEGFSNDEVSAETVDHDGRALGDDHDESSVFSPAAETAPLKPSTMKENPYIAPGQPATKYIPPSLRRSQGDNTDETQIRLRRTIQGQINRLSESNFISILRTVESLYQNNARQHVTSGLISTLLALVADAATLTDQFIILHGGFLAALYRVIGIDFGAQMLEQIVTTLDGALYTDSKKPGNLISLLAIMYSFQVIGNDIIYDLIRQFIRGFGEEDTELLLRMVRSCGTQLRLDNAAALKEIVDLVQTTANARTDELSVRQKFMIDTMRDLKNNKLRGGMASSASRLDIMSRMRKLLGTVKASSSKASEPMRITLDDIRNTGKKGKWWLVGASYHDPAKMVNNTDLDHPTTSAPPTSSSTTAPTQGDEGADLALLARRNGMNTQIRRSIFASLTTATDARHALNNIHKLRLKRVQREQIPLVLLRCLLAESSTAGYNPFYANVALELCADRGVRTALQFALWDRLRTLDGDDDAEDAQGLEGEAHALDARGLVSLAKFYARLIRAGTLSITVLLRKVPLGEWTLLSERTRGFVEVLLCAVAMDKKGGSSSASVVVKSRKGKAAADDSDPEDREVHPGLGVADSPAQALVNGLLPLDGADDEELRHMREGLRYVLSEVLPGSKVVEKTRHRRRLEEVCADAVALLGSAGKLE